MKKFIFLIFLLSLTGSTISAQQSTFPNINSNAQTKYLSDSISIIVTDTAISLLSLGYFLHGNQTFLNIEFNRHFVVKINDSIGLKKFSQISIPMNLDPSYRFHGPSALKINNHYILNDMNGYNEVKFKARGVGKEEDNEQISYTVLDSTRHKRVHYKTLDYANEFICNIHGLKIGSVVEFDYSYSLNPSQNIENFYSFNVFFDDQEPKDDFVLYYANYSHDEIKVDQYNNTSKFVNIDSMGVAMWHLTNLTGGINEIGSRPYTELPYISLFFQPINSLIYSAWRNGAQAIDGCYFAIKDVLDEIDTLDKASIISLSDYESIVSDCDYYKNKLSVDSAAFKIITNLHNDIVDSYRYNNNDPFYTSKFSILDKITSNIRKKELCEATKGKLYATYFKYLDLPFKIAYIDDNRSCVLNKSYIRPLFQKNYYLVTSTDTSNLLYFKPKNDDFGYYINEFPFYYENTISRHFDPNKIIIRDTNTNIEVTFYNTPQILFKDNERKTISSCLVDLKSETINFDANISLKGQYSTLTRNVYLYNYLDSTINPLYGETVYNLPNCKINSLNKVESQKESPFKTVFNIKYSLSKNINKLSDSLFTIDFSNWIIPVTDDVSLPRKTDYYTDFKGKDIYSITLNFNENIQLIDSPKIMFVENEFGVFSFSVNQINEKSIQLSSSFFTIKNMIKKEAFDTVISVFEAIKELKKNSKLTIKVIG